MKGVCSKAGGTECDTTDEFESDRIPCGAGIDRDRLVIARHWTIGIRARIRSLGLDWAIHCPHDRERLNRDSIALKTRLA